MKKCDVHEKSLMISLGDEEGRCKVQVVLKHKSILCKDD